MLVRSFFAFSAAAIAISIYTFPGEIGLPPALVRTFKDYGDFAFARIYSCWLHPHYEEAASEYKASILSKAKGRVLEIGIGPGTNFQYYSGEVTEIVGVEPNLYMIEELEKRVQDAKAKAASEGKADEKSKHIPQELFRGVVASTAEDLSSIPSDSVDTVVSTLVLCSVKSVKKSLAEIQRVLRPGEISR